MWGSNINILLKFLQQDIVFFFVESVCYIFCIVFFILCFIIFDWASSERLLRRKENLLTFHLLQQQLLTTFVSEQDGIPTSVDFVRDEIQRIVASYTSSHCVIFDMETAKPVVRLESSSAAEGVNAAARHINKIVCHPTLPLTITAHEDRHIRFWDNNTGKMVHSMVAHLDAVTSLSVDPNGLYILSGKTRSLLLM